jgi:hypothetical protein
MSTDEKPTITINIAAQVAKAKLQDLDKTDFTIVESKEIINEVGKSLCFIFSLNPNGYIVIPASYDLPPVIAYSFTSNFQNYADENPLYDMLYADLTLRLDNLDLIPTGLIEERHHQWDSYLQGSPVTTGRFEQWPPEGSTPTEGWVLTNWDQGAPYNNFCPLDLVNGGRSYAGCPAVAMAQIINYHTTTNDIAFTDSDDYHHTYGGNNYWIDNDYITYDFPSFPELNTYLDTLQYHYENQIPPTTNDKASLIFACGVAATQVYNAHGSGTFGVNQAYDAYQRFNCTTIELLDESDPDLYERLSSNMKDALPAHLAIVNEGWTSGHNLVVDGYNTDNFYHLNFGWSGSYDGWYLIPDELPYDLTVIEGIIVDILKEDSGVPDLTSDGTLDWTDVTPCQTVTGSFTVENIGESGSNLDWEITEWPTWGTWTFTPSGGNNLKPEDEPVTVTVYVEAPNEEHHLFTGNITVENVDDSSDSSQIPVSLETGYKVHEKIHCNGSLSWTDIKPGATITGSFTVENAGAPLSNLSWEITEWPEWGTWTFTPSNGNHLTPEDGPLTITVKIKAPLKKDTKFIGQIKIVNSGNTSDYDTIAVSLATPYEIHVTHFNIIKNLLNRFPHMFPLLHVLFDR